VGGGWEGKGGGGERRGRLHGLCALQCVCVFGCRMGDGPMALRAELDNGLFVFV
jgi:hypothetical protein